MLKCIAIDDEPLALEKLSLFLNKIEGIELIHTFSNCTEALGFLKTQEIDILFLDIQMNDITGIELMQQIKINAHVVIISAYDEFAVQGFELNVTDYIVKPFTFARLVKAIDKIDTIRQEIPATSKNFIFVKTDYRIIRIETKDIQYLEGMRDYICIRTTKNILTLLNFGELLRMLPSDKFIRVHKSFAVNLEHINAIEKDRIYMGEKIIPISKTYKEIFYNAIK